MPGAGVASGEAAAIVAPESDDDAAAAARGTARDYAAALKSDSSHHAGHRDGADAELVRKERKNYGEVLRRSEVCGGAPGESSLFLILPSRHFSSLR